VVRVRNLLEQRKRLKDKFSKEINITPHTITSNSLDHEFLNKALTIAASNLSNTTFDSKIFAEEMCLSRSQLHRKLQAITGLSTGTFIRSFRLKHAAKLLIENHYSITQIAFEVGFNSPSHFTKAFRQEFNFLPSEFKDKVIPQ
jgi:AraC-like DNA-binding protein